MDKVDLIDIARILLKRIWIIIIVFAVCAAGGFSYCQFFATPEYTASSRIVVTTGGIIANKEIYDTTSKITSADVSTSLAMLETYANTLDMVKMYEYVITDVGGDLNGKYSANNLKSMTSYTYSDTALIITVTVKCNDQGDAAKIANSVAKLAPLYLKEISPVASALTLEYSEGATKTFPKVLLITVGAGLAGALLTAIIIYLIAAADNTIKNEDDITKNGLTVLGIVPDFFEHKKGGYYYYRGY